MEKINTAEFTKEEVLEKVKNKAEELFRSGTFFCSEAVLSTINEYLGYPYDPSIVKMASSFPIGMGKAQCLCGAVSGGQMALGMVYGRNEGEAMNEKMFPISKGLHDHIVKDYGATCCRVITRQWAGDNFASPERKAHCIHITGDVAAWVADKLIDDKKIPVKES
ncbi:MAG: C-GCAxxG-C-C family protein, partial [Clostridiaceae bacterium]